MEMAIINSIDKSQSWNILAQKWNQLDLIVFIMLWTVLFNCFCWKKCSWVIKGRKNAKTLKADKLFFCQFMKCCTLIVSSHFHKPDDHLCNLFAFTLILIRFHHFQIYEFNNVWMNYLFQYVSLKIYRWLGKAQLNRTTCLSFWFYILVSLSTSLYWKWFFSLVIHPAETQTQ